MSKKISSQLRNSVIFRANNCCEYCTLSARDSYFGFQIDHIISIKHGGTDLYDNLAYSCGDYNRFKGSDIGTYLDSNQNFIRLFNPRKDNWDEHFILYKLGNIASKSEIGEATIKILNINHPDRIIERALLN